MTSQRDDVFIVGIGDLPFGKHPERNSLMLQAEAASLALSDAGLTLADVGGLISAGSRVDDALMPQATLAEYLGVSPAFSLAPGVGGASHCAAILHGALALQAGVVDTVLVVAGDNLRTGLSRRAAQASLADAAAVHPQLESPHGASMPALYALIAQRHCSVYGTSREQLADVAVAMRQYAVTNPYAAQRSPITRQDVLNARLIASPLGLLDCSPVSDGAAAFVLQRGDRSLPAGAVRVRGAAMRADAEHLSASRDITRTAARLTGDAVMRSAGLEPSDIDVFFAYDSFTIAVITQVEDLGFCAKGEGGAFVAGDALTLTGRLPTNTHGGLLSHGHPGRPGGIAHITEAVRQLRGIAVNQVDGAEAALIHGAGGPMTTHATVALAVA